MRMKAKLTALFVAVFCAEVLGAVKREGKSSYQVKLVMVKLIYCSSTTIW